MIMTKNHLLSILLGETVILIGFSERYYTEYILALHTIGYWLFAQVHCAIVRQQVYVEVPYSINIIVRQCRYIPVC